MKFKIVLSAACWLISSTGQAESFDEAWIINHAFDTYHPYQIAKLEAETALLDAASAKSAYQTKFYAVQSESFSAEPRDIQERISDLQNIAIEGTGQGEIAQTIGFRRDFGIGLQADLSLNVFERQPYQVTAEGTDESGNVTYNPIVKLTLRQSLLSGRGHTALDTDIAQTAADAEIASATQFSRRAEAASFASDLYWRIVIGEQEAQLLQREQSIISQLVVGMEQNLDAGLVNPMQLKLLQLRRMSNQSDVLELNHLLQTAVLDINRELQLDVNSQDLVFQSPKTALQVLSTELSGRDLQDWAMYVEGLARYRSAASKLESYRKSTGPRLDLVGTISQGSIAYRREDIQKAAEDKTYADWYVGLEFESTIGFDRQRRQKLASLSNQLLTETQNLERTETIFHKNIESFQSLAASLIERIDLAMTIRGENQTLLTQLEQAQRLGNVSMSQLLQFQLDAIEIEKRLIEIYRDAADLISIYRGYVSRV